LKRNSDIYGKRKKRKPKNENSQIVKLFKNPPMKPFNVHVFYTKVKDKMKQIKNLPPY